MAHKQLFGLKDQIGLINFNLGEVAKLEAEAPKAGEGAPFPVVMSAKVVSLSLGKARGLLEEAAALIQAEIDFYEAHDRLVAEIGAKEDAEKATLIEAEVKKASAQEPITAGIAAYCMQSVPAALIFMVKGMEKARSYRS